MEELLNQPIWRIIDQSTLGLSMDPKHSFAMDDALCWSIGQGLEVPSVRTWVHEKTIILGIQDSRLPHLNDGLKYIKEQGFHVVIRNSGGLAVVLDKGILNISFILPEKKINLSIDDGYELMAHFIRNMFSAYSMVIEDREITGSYCPGRYDLSINGQKFAGISQRRIRGGAAVQVYLCVTPSGAERAELVREFYKRALKGEQTRFTYPDIHPETMASLSELLGEPFTMNDVMTLFYQAMYKLGEIKIGSLTPEEITYYQQQLQQMVERNNKLG